MQALLAELRDNVAGLRAENATLTAPLRAVEVTRDQLLDENAQLKRQIAMQLRKVKRLGGGRHASS
jgi:hypothetical protein